MTPKDQLLVLEDSPDMRLLIQEVFKSPTSGMELHFVDSIARARDWLSRSRPDIALFDLMLPDGTALDLFPPSGGIMEFPTVILTGAGTPDDAVEVTRRGAWRYLYKEPKTIRELPAILADTLGDWQLRNGRPVRKIPATLVTRHITVRLGQTVLSREPGRILVVEDLGPGAAVFLFDRKLRLAGLVHGSFGSPLGALETALPAALQSMYDLGALRENLDVQLGGCHDSGEGDNRGYMNMNLVVRLLWRNGLALKANYCGQRSIRAMGLDTSTGRVMLDPEVGSD